MPTATLTSKGQITIPKPIRDRLSLKVGERLLFSLDNRGGIKVQRQQAEKIEILQGLLRHLAGKQPVTLEKMRDAVRQRAARKRAWTSKR
jgi:antitoxin PrlF